MLPPLWQKVKRCYKVSWWKQKWRVESKKPGLKLNIQKIQIMAIQSNHLMANRWGKMETVTDFTFLDSKITEDDDAAMK